MSRSGLRSGPNHNAEPLWQRVWLDAYPCDVPSSIPYPNIPLSALLETSARRFPDRSGCTLYGKSTSFRDLAEQARPRGVVRTPKPPRRLS